MLEEEIQPEVVEHALIQADCGGHMQSRLFFLGFGKMASEEEVPQEYLGFGVCKTVGGVAMMETANKNADVNPREMIELKVKQLDKNVKIWLKKQSAAVEAAVVTAGSAVGALMGTFNAEVASTMPTPPPGLNFDATASLQQAKAFAGGPIMQARNFAVNDKCEGWYY